MIKERKYDKRQKGTKILKIDRNFYHCFVAILLFSIIHNFIQFFEICNCSPVVDKQRRWKRKNNDKNS